MKLSCPRCGADVSYNPIQKKLYCDHCKCYSDINRAKTFELDQDEMDNLEKSKNIGIEGDLNSLYDEFECSSCGAKLVTDKTTMITRCVFCGSQQMIKQKLTGNFKPQRVIPFKISKEEFIRIFKNYLSKRFFAPSKLKNDPLITETKGLYVPFYIYNADMLVKQRGLAVKSINNKTEEKWFECEHEETISVPIDASKKLDDNIMVSLEPFDFYDLVEFNPSYLAGFQADCLDEPIESVYSKVNQRLMIPSYDLDDDMPGFVHKAGLRRCEVKKIAEPEYVLLPVWFLNLKYNGKTYSYAVNGQTGKVVGRIPINYAKYFSLLIFLTILFIRNTFA